MSSEPLEVEIVIEQLRRKVPGGIGTYCLGLLQGLSAMASPDSLSVRLRASRISGATDPLAGLGWPLQTLPLSSRLLTRAWDHGISVGWMGRRSGAVVHATSIAAPPVRHSPLVVMVHDLAWRRFPEGYPARGRRWHEAALGRAASHASRFVVPSDLTAADLLAGGFGVSERQVEVIPEGLDHLAPPDQEAAAELLESLGIPPGGGYLLTVGTLEPRKNLSRLVEAYSRICHQLPERWPLVVVGPRGWGADPAAGLDGAEGVRWAGRVADGVLSALYRSARCLAYVPLFEGFGLPAGEALASGTPVVATKGLPSTAGACLEVDPLDLGAIGDALLLAANESPERQRLVAAGRERSAQLTWEACAARHVEVWREVAGSAGSRVAGGGER